MIVIVGTGINSIKEFDELLGELFELARKADINDAMIAELLYEWYLPEEHEYVHNSNIADAYHDSR